MTLDEYIELRQKLRLVEQLNSQDKKLDEIKAHVQKNNWLRDFSSNIAGNAVWDGTLWLFNMLRKL